jgi:hypothetical protein
LIENDKYFESNTQRNKFYYGNSEILVFLARNHDGSNAYGTYSVSGTVLFYNKLTTKELIMGNRWNVLCFSRFKPSSYLS